MLKMQHLLLVILSLSFFPALVFGQSDSLGIHSDYQAFTEKKLVLITGYQVGINQFAEIGIGMVTERAIGPHSSTLIYGVSNEFNISSDFIWGLKVGMWTGGSMSGINLGLNMVNYTDFKENALRFRPEIGLGFSAFRIVYGYNFPIINPLFRGVNTHHLGMNIMLGLKKMKMKDKNSK